MDVAEALRWASGRRNAVLVTIRRDGRPQSSDIAYAVIGDEIRISVTADRAKTRNIARDDRVVVHITDPPSWSYISFDGRAELSPVTTAPDDATADLLAELYETITGGAHPDWDEFRAAMIDEGRLVIRFRPASATGQIN